MLSLPEADDRVNGTAMETRTAPASSQRSAEEDEDAVGASAMRPATSSSAMVHGNASIVASTFKLSESTTFTSSAISSSVASGTTCLAAARSAALILCGWDTRAGRRDASTVRTAGHAKAPSPGGPQQSARGGRAALCEQPAMQRHLPM